MLKFALLLQPFVIAGVFMLQFMPESRERTGVWIATNIGSYITFAILMLQMRKKKPL